ncbi:hypothetical protein VTJ83DRAFT_2888 [Remersonia thermophila]|uniref:protein-ribulosamine 3-kinase n=1 Tax=Remersonia thermophila TaxID=72144 RepID=A0ABR4DCH1_9PEZI
MQTGRNSFAPWVHREKKSLVAVLHPLMISSLALDSGFASYVETVKGQSPRFSSNMVTSPSPPPTGLLKIDPAILFDLPPIQDILNVTELPGSRWARLTRIHVLHADGTEQRYFLKISHGSHGLAALQGEHAATLAIHHLAPSFCPRPIAVGTLRFSPTSHFYLCQWHDFLPPGGPLPPPAIFCAQLARMHHGATSPNGKFGFHCTTYNGDLPQDNRWCDTWEELFVQQLRGVLAIREERAGGKDEELEALMPGLFGTVIPRLLRPLETRGRRLRPALVHGDLWCGNVGVVDGGDAAGMVFDPAAFWGHHEYEFGNWRPHRNRFDGRYFEAYHALVERSEPKEDYDDRNMLYGVRFNLNASALFPDNAEFLEMAIKDIRYLVNKFPYAYAE